MSICRGKFFDLLPNHQIIQPIEEKGGETKMTTIVVADNHHIIREGLRALLEAEPDFHIIGEAADGLETVQMVKSLQPDVMVVDLMMSGMNGLKVTRQVKKYAPKTAIVIYSMYSDEGYVIAALKGGAKAYVLKEASSEELVRAIHEVAAGRHYLSQALSERAIEAYIKKPKYTQ